MPEVYMTVRALAGLSLAALVAACGVSKSSADGGPDAGSVTVTITSTTRDTTFVAREAFLAAGEMQISGEPLAEAMGRILSNYSRDHVPSDLYFDNSPNASGPFIDLAGFSTGVESYEYSKQPMNEVGFELGAGTSLVHGPLIDVDGGGGQGSLAAMAARLTHFAEGSHAEGRFAFPAGTYPAANGGGGNFNLDGSGTGAQNPLGWPGIWPTVHVFQKFDPTVNPTSSIGKACAISSDDDPGGAGALGCADYECDSTSMHLVNRAAQITPIITPGADGFSGWKFGLWVLNYLQTMHDAQEHSVSGVDAGALAAVGSIGNQIVGNDGNGKVTLAGTYLASSDIEGFQAQMFIEEMDNRAEDWLMHLGTADGTTLSGFSSLSAAQAYSYSSPLQWFPAEVSVAESNDASGFPVPAYSLHSANSELMDQLGLAMGYAEFYSLTDVNNHDVGGAQAARVFFDGDPFAAGSGAADGMPNFQQRALAMMRVSMVNLDRLHTDPATGAFVDEVTMSGTTEARGATVQASSVAYSILGLRTVLRSLSSQLELYSNNTTDSALGATPLDAAALPLHLPGAASTTFTQRLAVLLKNHAALFFDQLTDATGRAYSGWNFNTSAPSDQSDSLDAHTAAIRGLFAAYLATGDTKYYARAIAVFNRMEVTFYDPDARVYSATPAPVDSVTYTPLRFALLQSSLRDMYELVAARPGGESVEPLLEERVARLNKLVLNGWDDRNQDRIVEWPAECVRSDALPDGGAFPYGGLQMAERTLTGETGSFEEHLDAGQARTQTVDREHDCVPEVDDAHLPSALAASITFLIARSTH